MIFFSSEGFLAISQPMILVFSLDGTYLYQQKVRYLDSFSIITQIHITSQTCFSRFNYSWSRQAKNLDSSYCYDAKAITLTLISGNCSIIHSDQDQKNSSFKKRSWDWAVHVGNVWQDLGRLQLRHDISLLFIGLHENLTEKVSTIK